MIPILILYLAKKFGLKTSQHGRIEVLLRHIQKVVVLIILSVVVKANASNFTNANSENKSVAIFKVLKNDKIIGTIEIVKQQSDNIIIYNVSSEINAKFILKARVVGKETYVFKNGILEYSSLYRTLNNKVKVDQSLVYENGEYYLKKLDSEKLLDLKEIGQNLVMLYFLEPQGTDSIYWDLESEMVNVQCIGKGIYKVKLSSGKYNTFYYEHGRCVKINAVSPLFSVTLIPEKS